MYTIETIHRAVREARQSGNLTQRQLADRVGTSQPFIAALERGGGNPTIDTIARCAAAAGFALEVRLTPLATHDPIIALYKQNVDRTLLRQNLRRSVDERLRSLGEWQENVRLLAEATARAKRARRAAASARG